MRVNRILLPFILSLLFAGGLFWQTGACQAQTLVRQPYLQKGTPTSMTVVWRTLLPQNTLLRYGSSPANLDHTISSADPVTDHVVEITGLQPETRYFYSVGTDTTTLAGGDTSTFFETSPPAGARRPFRAWVVGDSGRGLISAAVVVRDAMLNETQGAAPDIYLHMGDMAYSDGTDLEFTFNFYAVYESILKTTVTWPTLGNHEGHSSESGTESGPYYEGYVLPKNAEAGGVASGTEAYYSFDYANVHFVVLDSYDSPRQVDGAMFTWLEEDLAATDQDWLIAYWHHPPYTKGSHDSDTEQELIEMRERALPILEGAGVDIVFGGHSHTYERSFLLNGAYETPSVIGDHIVDGGDGQEDGDGAYVKSPRLNANEGTVYVVAGHGGTSVEQSGSHPLMFFEEAENGSVIMDVDGRVISVRNVRYDGQITDHFTLAKGPAGSGLLFIEPHGGESFAAGTTVNVQWDASDVTSQVLLEYSHDAGASWSDLVVAPNTGSWTWTVPVPSTDRARLRISPLGQPDQGDESGEFRVTNQAPTLGAMGPYTVVEGETLRFDVSADDPESMALTYSMSPAPQGASLNATTGAFSWVPGYGQAGQYNVQIQATDGEHTATQPVAIVVTEGNRAPELGAIADQQVTAGQEVRLELTATDADGDALTFSLVNGPDGLTVDANGTVTWTTSAGDVGTHPVEVQVSDGSASDTGTFQVRVTQGASNNDPANNGAEPTNNDPVNSDNNAGADNNGGDPFADDGGGDGSGSDDDGCGCSTVGDRRPGSMAALALVALVGVVLLRRR